MFNHCVVSEVLEGEVSLEYLVTPSDHIPLTLNVHVRIDVYPAANVVSTNRAIKWGKISVQQKYYYSQAVQNRIAEHEWKMCVNPRCNNRDHRVLIDTETNFLIDVMKICSNDVLLRAPTTGAPKCGVINGWNKFIRPLYNDYQNALLTWRTNGKDAILFNDVSVKRKKFKYALRKCRRQKEQRLKDELALSYDGKDFVKFWSATRKQGKGSEQISSAIDGVVGGAEISDHWAGLFEKLFNLDQSNKHEAAVYKYIKSYSGSNMCLSEGDITEAIFKLKKNKCAGSENLQAEHYRNCATAISKPMCQLINSMIAHGYIPTQLMTVVISPILKKKGLNEKVSVNYRPIAIASVFSKVIELLILENIGSKLRTSDNQFGFKRRVGTEMAVYSVKQIAHHYLRHGTPVYACYLDASKAFDMVNHYTLLKKLCDRGVPPIIIGFLTFWFRNQTFRVRWGSQLSRHFAVRNSVRQGSCASPYYFAVYLDCLSDRLSESGVGCRIGSVIVNHLCFADDIILLTTSIRALKLLLEICEEFAYEHDLIFNPSKTVCQAFCDSTYDYSVPLIKFCGRVLIWKETVRYLGYDISCRDRDIEELLRRKRELYFRANLIKSRFFSCSPSVKRYLFRTYFSNIYCNSLWVPVKKQARQSVKVAYNDACRIIFGYSRKKSASGMFCENQLTDFNALMRISAYSLLNRLANSDNVIIRAIINSRVFMNSAISKEWKSILFNICEN